MPSPALTALLGARDAQGFDPFSISWYSAFWAEDPLWTPPADGGAVSSWKDRGSQNIDATEATNQPLYRASVAALKNKPAVDFDGTNDLLTCGWNYITLISVMTG